MKKQKKKGGQSIRSICFGSFLMGAMCVRLFRPTASSARNPTSSTTSTVNHLATNNQNKAILDPNRHVRNAYFRTVAQSLEPTTDKVGPQHSYHEVYGTFLLPYYHSIISNNDEFKMLEIGLGCNMRYGPGASVQLWKTLMPQKLDLWEAESNLRCVEEHLSKNQTTTFDFHLLVGDQASPDVLENWIQKSNGGNFHVIIDDGGHGNCQMSNSFRALWPHVLPGGLYFIEDLHIAGDEGTSSNNDNDSTSKAAADHQHCNSTTQRRFTDQLLDWTEQLMYVSNKVAAKRNFLRPRGKDSVAFIHCIKELCVLGKQNE